MTIKSVYNKTDYSELRIDPDKDIIKLKYEFYGQDEDFDTFIKIEFDKNDYKNGLLELQENSKTLIKGQGGALELSKNEDGSHKMIIMTPLQSLEDYGHRQIFPKVEYQFYTLN